jgi:hypothetical protein
MWISRKPEFYGDTEPWGFDNGAFSAWLERRPFPAEEFEKRLMVALRITGSRIPQVAVTPDLVGGGTRSLEFSLGWLDRLPPEWPWYLAVQDGMHPEDVIEALPLFAGIFLGGTTPFKGSAPLWAHLAHEHGKRFHYARAGTPRRIEAARYAGADSLDSSFPLWTKARWTEFEAMVEAPSPQLELAEAMGRMLKGPSWSGDPQAIHRNIPPGHHA